MVHSRAKSPKITKKRTAAAKAQPGAERGAPGAAAAAGNDITRRDGDDVSDDEGDDASPDALALASGAAARPRRSSYSRADADRLEKLEDTVLELQAEVADLTQQARTLLLPTRHMHAWISWKRLCRCCKRSCCRPDPTSSQR